MALAVIGVICSAVAVYCFTVELVTLWVTRRREDRRGGMIEFDRPAERERIGRPW